MWGFLGIGNAMIKAFNFIYDKAQNTSQLKGLFNLFAYSMDIMFLVGILIILVGVIWVGIEAWGYNHFSEDEDKKVLAKKKLKKSIISTLCFFLIPIFVLILGFVISASGVIGS